MIDPAFLISIGAAAVMVSFGIDQIRNPGAWTGFIPPFLNKLLPTKSETSMRVHGVGNLLFGLFLASQLYPVVAAWVAFIWWLSILPFAFRYSWQIAMRDLAITLSLLALILTL